MVLISKSLLLLFCVPGMENKHPGLGEGFVPQAGTMCLWLYLVVVSSQFPGPLLSYLGQKGIADLSEEWLSFDKILIGLAS